jgi:hypothetical protein
MAYEWRKGDLEWARPKIDQLDLTKILKKKEEKIAS